MQKDKKKAKAKAKVSPVQCVCDRFLAFRLTFSLRFQQAKGKSPNKNKRRLSWPRRRGSSSSNNNKAPTLAESLVYVRLLVRVFPLFVPMGESHFSYFFHVCSARVRFFFAHAFASLFHRHADVCITRPHLPQAGVEEEDGSFANEPFVMLDADDLYDFGPGAPTPPSRGGSSASSRSLWDLVFGA